MQPQALENYGGTMTSARMPTREPGLFDLGVERRDECAANATGLRAILPANHTGDRFGDRRPTVPIVVVAYWVMGLLLVGYIVMLMLHPQGRSWSFVQNWGVDGFEVVAGGLCLARAVVGGSRRSVALILGVGLLAWALGDVIWTLETRNGGNPPTPSLADGFYLVFYPLAYVAVIRLMRMEVRRLPLAKWLDGAVAGLGAAAVCAAFAFDTILHAIGGPPAALATNLAYPIGDLILLALVIGALAMLPTWRSAQWLILALGCAVDAVGDTIYLFQSSAGTYHVGTLLDATWPTAILLTSLAVWQPSVASKRPEADVAPRFVLPVIAAGCGLAVLLQAALSHVGRVAVALAVATLFAVLVRSLLSFRDLRLLTETSAQQALTDELTGLGNRRKLMRVLDGSFSNRGTAVDRNHLALLLIDLDHFKEINDSFGHAVGDQILTMLGPRLQSALRATDVLTRIGGDEFGIVLSDADARYATTIAERLTTQLEQPFTLDIASLHVSASVGIALSPEHARDGAELLRCADVAMYRAKAARSSFDVYDAALDEGRSRIQLMEQLRTAIGTRALELFYQPQFDLRTDEMVAVEALLRWRHSELGIISPDDFIPLAEEAGLMRPLTDFVVDSALAQCASWRASGHDISVSVNLSATNLLDVGLPGRIDSLLAKHRLESGSLVLEVTETTMMADRERSREVIQHLRSLGLTVSIDDFGTGFSSLAYLSNLAVGELKIDRSLLEPPTVADDRRNEAIVRATIDLGHSLGLRVVAEGIETPGAYELLASLGCDRAQGYFMGRPLPAEQLVFSPVAPRLVS